MILKGQRFNSTDTLEQIHQNKQIPDEHFLSVVYNDTKKINSGMTKEVDGGERLGKKGGERLDITIKGQKITKIFKKP